MRVQALRARLREKPEAVPMSFKVMVVDDELPALEVATALLEHLGCQVTTFADSQQAAERLEKERYDGLVVDARMPEVDGFELTRQVRASTLNGKLPIVMLTGYDDPSTMCRGFSSGITFFLGKPITIEQAETVFNAIRGAKLKDQGCPRFPIRRPVRGRSGAPLEKEFEAASVNISEGGMLLELAGSLDVGEEIELEIKWPSVTEPIKARARVVRKEALERIAVQFTSLAPEDREAIRRSASFDAQK